MDSAKIAEIAAVMEAHGLSRVCLEEPDGTTVELERGVGPAPMPQPGPPMMPPAPPAPPAPACAPAAAPAPSLAAEPEGEAPMDMSHTTAVRAPMVGVFYAAPAPGAEPFVHVGSKVKKGETLCILEAMKLMNEVAAERDGEVVEVCVNDGELVEYGRVLFRIY